MKKSGRNNNRVLMYFWVAVVLFVLANPTAVLSGDRQASRLKQRGKSLAELQKKVLESSGKYEKQGDAKSAANNYAGAISDYAQAVLLLPPGPETKKKQQILLLKQARAHLLLQDRDGVERFFATDLLRPDKNSSIILYAMLGEYKRSLEKIDHENKLGLSQLTEEQLIRRFKEASGGTKYSAIDKTFLFLRTITDTLGGFDYHSAYYRQIFRLDYARLQKTFPTLFERYMAFCKITEIDEDEIEALGMDFIKRFPSQALGYLLVAESRRQQEKWQDVAAYLDKATRFAPYYLEDIDRMLNSLSEHGHAEEVIRIAQRILTTSPNNSDILESLFYANLALKNYPAALHIITANEQKIPHELQAIIPVLYLQNKDWPNAQKRFQELTEDEQIGQAAKVYLLAGQQEGIFSLNAKTLKQLEKFRHNVLEKDSDDNMMKFFNSIVKGFQANDFSFLLQYDRS